MRLVPCATALATLLIVSTVAPAILAGVAVAAFWLFRPEPVEHPPPPLSPATDLDRHIIELADQFAKRSGAIDAGIPIKIEPWPRQDGSYRVTYWTPRKEFRLLGPRAAIVNPQLGSVEFTMRD